jgi:hypothetical protein
VLKTLFKLPDANSVMLSRNDFSLSKLVQRRKILLVHDLLVDAATRAQLVGGLEP